MQKVTGPNASQRAAEGTLFIPRGGSPQKVTGQNASLMIADVETLHCNVCAVARSISRRAGTSDALSGCDRRTYRLQQRGEAREGYAQVSFLGALCSRIETVLLPAPGKILRDSPTRRDTPKKE